MSHENGKGGKDRAKQKRGDCVLKKKNVIEALKTLECRARLYRHKLLFELMLNPRVLLLRLKMSEWQAKGRAQGKLRHRRGGELRGHAEHSGDNGDS